MRHGVVSPWAAEGMIRQAIMKLNNDAHCSGRSDNAGRRVQVSLVSHDCAAGGLSGRRAGSFSPDSKKGRLRRSTRRSARLFWPNSAMKPTRRLARKSAFRSSAMGLGFRQFWSSFENRLQPSSLTGQSQSGQKRSDRAPHREFVRSNHHCSSVYDPTRNNH